MSLIRNGLIHLALCCSAGLAAAADRPASTQIVQFDVTAANMEQALTDLASQAGLRIVFFPETVKGVAASTVRGAYTAQAALDMLLANSDLKYSFIDSQTVAISAVSNGRPSPAPTAEATTGDASTIRLAQTASAEQQPTAEKSSAEGDRPVSALEEIVVTAQKRAERLQDVPVPVSAINGEALANSNQLQLQDYYAKIPGLSLALAGDTDSPWISIRGITTGGYTNPTVGVVVDDVPYGGTIVVAAPPSPPDIDPGDLARVEVLRGPQGTLYGASSMGGLLKFVTIDPSTSGFSGRMQAGLSSVEGGEVGHSLRGSVNMPLSESLAVRASAFTSREPGYVDNVLTNEDDVNRRDSDGGRLAALWRPTDTLTLKLNALFQDSERLGPSDINVALGDDLEQSAARGTGAYTRNTRAYSLIATETVGQLELVSATGYSIDKIFTSADFSELAGGLFVTVFAQPLFGVSGAVSPVHRRFEKFSQELRGSVPLGERVQWLLGAFYTDEKAEGGGTFDAVDPLTGEYAGLLYSNDSPTTFEEYAAFTNLTFALTDRFDIQVGGRYSRNQESLAAIRGGPVGAAFFGENPSIIERRETSDNSVTYLVTPRLKLSPDLMIYGRVASGYRPGGVNLGCGFTPCAVHADTTENYEVGIKGDLFERALSFDASIYYIDWSDIQTTLNLNGFGYQANAGKAKSQGMELAMESRLPGAFTLTGWVALGEAELTQDFPLTSQNIGRTGDRLPYSSRISGNLSLARAFAVTSEVAASLETSLIYVGDRKGTFQVTPARETFPSYTQVDLRGSLQYDTWTLNAFVNNVTDERGILRGGLDGIGSTFFTYIQPRLVGVSLTKVFE